MHLLQAQKNDDAIKIGEFVIGENIRFAVRVCEELCACGYGLPTMYQFIDGRRRYRPSRLASAGTRNAHKTIRDRQKAMIGEALIEHINTVDCRARWSELPGDERGYVHACLSLKPDLREVFTTPLPYYLRADARARHQLVTGSSGSGKSQAMLSQIEALLRQKSGSVVVIDPHGDFAEGVAKLNRYDNHSDLTYINPSLSDTRFPSVNPFFTEDHSDKNIDRLTTVLVDVIGEIVGTEFSTQMRVLLGNCISTLLLRPGSRMHDLVRFVHSGEDEDRHFNADNHELVQYALEHHTSALAREFFRSEFPLRTYNQTKKSVRMRLLSLLGNRTFERFIDTNTPSIEIDKILNRGGHIILSSGKGDTSSEVSQAMGNFLLSSVVAYAFRQSDREERERHKVYLYADEAHNYQTPSLHQVLAETRKFGVYFTGATQFIGTDHLDRATREMFRENTNVRLMGKGSLEARAATAKLAGVSEQDISTLKPGCFAVSVGDAGGSVVVRMSDRLLREPTEHFLSPTDWEERKQKQLALWYREPAAHQEERTETSPRAEPESEWKPRNPTDFKPASKPRRTPPIRKK